jgi:tetratricopeptide (TPR) repeat protein
VRCLFSLLTRRASSAAVALISCALGDPAFSQDAASASGVALVDGAPIVIKDPHYGEALFYFHQGRFFTAATKLMASQHFERVRHQTNDAEILRIGLLLSYGAHKEAGKAFLQLGENGASPAVRDRAGLYFAKTFYQRGQLAESEKAINRLTHSLSPELEEERAVLKANLLMMGRQDYAGAANELEQVRIKQGLGPYARFNLGVALIKSGREARGIELLDEIGKAPATTEESAALRDKANLAIGVAALQADHPENARAYLERVRLNGMLANMALLQLGWADAALKRPKAALVPWTELSVRTPIDAAVIEVKLAVPWAFAALGEDRQASDRYKDAIAIFEQEKRDLDVSIAAIRSGKLLSGLLELNAGEETGWFWNITQLPDMPHGAHVAQVLAQHPFQEALKDYHDLTFLARNLDRWKVRLGVLKGEVGRADARVGKFNDRIAEAERRVQAMTTRVAALLVDQQRYVQDLAVAALEAQKERLASYDRYARFAAEQIYDRARKEKSNADRPR